MTASLHRLAAGAEAGAYYTNDAAREAKPRNRDEYYARDGAGTWWSTGGTVVRHGAPIDRGSFRALCAGLHPGSGAPLVRGAGPGHWAGLDLTLTPGKSVSLLWAAGTTEQRAAIEAAHRRAVEAALGFVEREGLVLVRSGAGGKRKDRPSDLIVARYDHYTTREGDPNIRAAIPDRVRLHVLGFGKIENLGDIDRYGVASFDTTSPLLRAFKDARKNYWSRDDQGRMSYYTAIRIPQAIENNRLKVKALEGRLDQVHIKALERAALEDVRAFATGIGTLEAALDDVMAYWAELNWDDDASPARRALAIGRQRDVYARTLRDRPWEACQCRTCRESGVEVLVFRSSNRNKRRGIHNLKVFYDHLQTHRSGSNA